MVEELEEIFGHLTCGVAHEWFLGFAHSCEVSVMFWGFGKGKGTSVVVDESRILVAFIVAESLGLSLPG